MFSFRLLECPSGRGGTCLRFGTTLVEVLVVISVIGILASLLLGAIQYARESVRKSVCGNNLRQLGLACHAFENSHEHLPPGYTSSSGGLQYSTWIVSLVPSLEMGPLYSSIEEDHKNFGHPFREPQLHRAFGQTLSILRCPSDASWPNQKAFPEYGVVGFTGYLGVSGTDFKAEDGPFRNDYGTRFAEFQDGLSNTILIGERPPSRDRYFGWWYAGYGQNGTSSLDSLLGTKEINLGTRGNLACRIGPHAYGPGNAGDQCSCLHYWSYHSGGAQFCYADGSVRFIAYDSANILSALGTIAGGEVVRSVQNE